MDINHQRFACQALGLVGTQGFFGSERLCTPDAEQVVHHMTGRDQEMLSHGIGSWQLNTHVVARQ